MRTTEQIRRWYSISTAWNASPPREREDLHKLRLSQETEFDAWLTEEIRKASLIAWERGVYDARLGYIRQEPANTLKNPYEED